MRPGAREGRPARFLYAAGRCGVRRNRLCPLAMAMAMAELGQFAEATRVQRSVVAAAQQAGLDDVVVLRLTENLSLYESEQPCRRPIGADEMP